MYASKEFTPRFGTLDVLGKEVTVWDSEWYHHPGPYFSIRWMEIDPGGHATAVIAILKRHDVPFSREGEYLRVWGYYSPSIPPVFEF